MKYLTLLFSFVMMLNIQIAQAAPQDASQVLTMDQSTMQKERVIEQQMKNIKDLLNPLMLEDNPKAEFKKMVPQIKSFSEVKKVEFKGNQFYVEFSNGSESFWDLP